MNQEDIKNELNKYIADIKALNKQLEDLDAQNQKIAAQKSEILKVGTRIEGIVAFLRTKLSPAELAEIDGTPAPAAEAAKPEPAAAA